MALLAYLRRLFAARSVFTAEQAAYQRYRVGERTYGSPSVLDWNDGTTLSIGKYCSIAKNVTILVGGEHHLEWVTTYPLAELLPGACATGRRERTARSKGNVVIMNDVWIGAGATILSGVTLHNGCVIGAGSVVTRDVPAYAVSAGNPAKVLRYRFTQEQIRRLESVAWWDWPDGKIRAACAELLSPEIERFLGTHESLHGSHSTAEPKGHTP